MRFIRARSTTVRNWPYCGTMRRCPCRFVSWRVETTGIEPGRIRGAVRRKTMTSGMWAGDGRNSAHGFRTGCGPALDSDQVIARHEGCQSYFESARNGMTAYPPSLMRLISIRVGRARWGARDGRRPERTGKPTLDWNAHDLDSSWQPHRDRPAVPGNA